MRRVLRRLVIVLVLAALAAVGLIVFNSGDPAYELQEVILFNRYHRYDTLIRDVAKKHELDPMLVKAVVWRESRFQPGKVGGHGERGLMQVTEVAAADWVAAEKIETFVPTDLFDPRTNLEVGTWYLQRARHRWKKQDEMNPEAFALAEYNAGRSRVNQWVDDTNLGKRATADDLRDNISFPGTRNYVRTILDRYEFYKTRGKM